MANTSAQIIARRAWNSYRALDAIGVEVIHGWASER
jgi:hypothetical protein